MPCSEYHGKQRRLCFATGEFKDFSRREEHRDRKSNEISVLGITANDLNDIMFI